MILEVAVMVSLTASGALLLRVAGLRGWALLPLGLIVGGSVITVVATLQAAFALPTWPIATHAIAVGGPALLWVLALRAGREVRFSLLGVGATVALLVPVVWVLREARLARISPDSFNLIMTATLLEDDRLDQAPGQLLEAWQVALGALHAPAGLQGEFYLRSYLPLLALATVGALIWFTERSIAGLSSRCALAWWSAALAGVLLLSNQRFLYHALYLNRHLVIAVTVLVAAASAWGLARGAGARRPVLVVLLATSLPALAAGRAETPVIAGMILLPLLTTAVVPRRTRALLLAELGGIMLIWNASLVWRYVSADQDPSETALLLALGGVVVWLLAVAVALGWRWFDPLPRWILHVGEASLWVLLVVLTVRQPGVLYRSATATIANVVYSEGGWGVSLLMLAIISLGVLLVTQERDRIVLRLPMTTFVPFALVLAYVRAPEGLPYRVGHHDSLNRMLFHLVPLAILYIATASTASLRRRLAVPDDPSTAAVHAQAGERPLNLDPPARPPERRAQA
jgi:hypothetical protein